LVEMMPEIQRLVDSTRTSDELQQKIDRFIEGRKRQLSRSASYSALVEAYGRALASEDAGDFDAAIAAWDKAAKMSPEGADNCGRRATAYKRVRGG
jgi:tetratricopeptide (TPR) repeat protein